MINILITDDNDINILVLRALIEEWCETNGYKNYNIEEAVNGKEAIELIKHNKYNFVFLDIMMPIMDGLEALKHIRKLPLNNEPIIIIASAVIDDERNKERARKEKANAYIVKPITYEVVDIMMKKYVNKKEDKFVDFEEKIEETNNSLDLSVQMSAKEFLNEYPLNIIDIDDIDELVQDFSSLIQNITYSPNIEDDKENLIDNLLNLRKNLFGFSELEELIAILNNMVKVLESRSVSSIKKVDIFSTIMISIIEELSTWINHVFVKQDEKDIFYINKTISDCNTLLKDAV